MPDVRHVRAAWQAPAGGRAGVTGHVVSNSDVATLVMVTAEPTRDVVEPTADDAFACVRAAVARVMEVAPATVKPELRLVEDLGADSLAVVEMAELMEDEMTRRFRVYPVVDNMRLPQARTVSALAELLWQAVAPGHVDMVRRVEAPHDGTRGE